MHKNKYFWLMPNTPSKEGSSLLRSLDDRAVGATHRDIKSKDSLPTFAEDELVKKEHYNELFCALPGLPRSTFLMVFSPDGSRVASTHGNHNIYVTDIKSGRNIKTLVGHPRTPWCIAFHPTSNQIIASGCLGGEVRIWDLSGGSEVWTTSNQSVIASIAFHPIERVLVIATYNELYFWDWSKPEPSVHIATSNPKEKIRYIAFDNLGHKLITGIANCPQSRWEKVKPATVPKREDNIYRPRGIIRTSNEVTPNTSSDIQSNDNRTSPVNRGRDPFSIFERERRITVSYTNLMKEYEQLVQRYIRVYNSSTSMSRQVDGDRVREAIFPAATNVAQTSDTSPNSNVKPDEPHSPRTEPQPSTSRNCSSSLVIPSRILLLKKDATQPVGTSKQANPTNTETQDSINKQKGLKSSRKMSKAKKMKPYNLNEISKSIHDLSTQKVLDLVPKITPIADAAGTSTSADEEGVGHNILKILCPKMSRKESTESSATDNESSPNTSPYRRQGTSNSPAISSNNAVLDHLSEEATTSTCTRRSLIRNLDHGRINKFSSLKTLRNHQKQVICKALSLNNSPTQRSRNFFEWIRSTNSTGQSSTVGALKIIEGIFNNGGSPYFDRNNRDSLSKIIFGQSNGHINSTQSNGALLKFNQNDALIQNNRYRVNGDMQPSSLLNVVHQEKILRSIDVSNILSRIIRLHSDYKWAQGVVKIDTNRSKPLTIRPFICGNNVSSNLCSPGRLYSRKLQSHHISGFVPTKVSFDRLTVRTRHARHKLGAKPYGNNTLGEIAKIYTKPAHVPLITRPSIEDRLGNTSANSQTSDTISNATVRQPSATLHALKEPFVLLKNLHKSSASNQERFVDNFRATLPSTTIQSDTNSTESNNNYARNLEDTCNYCSPIAMPIYLTIPDVQRQARLLHQSESVHSVNKRIFETEQLQLIARLLRESLRYLHSLQDEHRRTDQTENSSSDYNYTLERSRYGMSSTSNANTSEDNVQDQFISYHRQSHTQPKTVNIDNSKSPKTCPSLYRPGPSLSNSLRLSNYSLTNSSCLTVLSRKLEHLLTDQVQAPGHAEQTAFSRFIPKASLSERVTSSRLQDCVSRMNRILSSGIDNISSFNQNDNVDSQESALCYNARHFLSRIADGMSRHIEEGELSIVSESIRVQIHDFLVVALLLCNVLLLQSIDSISHINLYRERESLVICIQQMCTRILINRSNGYSSQIIRNIQHMRLTILCARTTPAGSGALFNQHQQQETNQRASTKTKLPSVPSRTNLRNPFCGRIVSYGNGNDRRQNSTDNETLFESAIASSPRQNSPISAFHPNSNNFSSVQLARFNPQRPEGNISGQSRIVPNSDLDPAPNLNSSRETSVGTHRIPSLQVNDVPVSEQLPQRLLQRQRLTERLSEMRYFPQRSVLRPRFLNPFYSATTVDTDLDEHRETNYDPDIVTTVTPNHRIQVWDIMSGDTPIISNPSKNVIVSECKIHNDASVDIAKDGTILVALLPSGGYLNVTNRLGVYSLKWETLGQCLYTTSFEQNAVSVAFSPLCRHLVVGLASRRVSIVPAERWIMARIFAIDQNGATGNKLSVLRELSQTRDSSSPGYKSVNCIRWLPTSGQGLIYATNTGKLIILS